MNKIVTNYKKILSEIDLSRNKFKLPPNQPKLVAVSKTFPKEKIQQLINHGHLIFGENNFPYLLDDLNLKILKDSLKKNQVLIIGATRFQNNKYYNSLINITESKVTYFDKKILVPFGEFLPLRDSLTFLERIVGPNNYSSIA